MVKSDCFAYDKEKCVCKALLETYCTSEECNFYKTKAQVEKERKKYESQNRAENERNL